MATKRLGDNPLATEITPQMRIPVTSALTPSAPDLAITPPALAEWIGDELEDSGRIAEIVEPFVDEVKQYRDEAAESAAEAGQIAIGDIRSTLEQPPSENLVYPTAELARETASDRIGYMLRSVYGKLGDYVMIDDFGAIGDGTLHTVAEWLPGGPRVRFASLADLQSEYPHVTSTTDSIDWAAFQAALDASFRVSLRRQARYICNRGLLLQDKHYITGEDGVANTDSLSLTACAKVVFTGSGAACFSMRIPGVQYSYGGMANFSVRVTGTYDWICDFPQLIGIDFSHWQARQTALTGGGIRSRRVGQNSWNNQFSFVHIHLPDGSAGAPLWHDMSNSQFTACSFTGGIGSWDEGFGVDYVAGTVFHRSSGWGLTISKVTDRRTVNITGARFDANAYSGVRIYTGDDQTSGLLFSFTITGTSFRSVNPGTGIPSTYADIWFDNPSGRLYRGGTIGSNVHQQDNVRASNLLDVPWDNVVEFTGSDVNNGYLFPFDPFSLRTKAHFGRKGVMSHGLIAARASWTLRGVTNVSGAYGTPGDGPMALIRVAGGTRPMLTSSPDAAGANVSVDIGIGAEVYLRFEPDSPTIAPLTNDSRNLGAASRRFGNVYTRRMYIGPPGSNIWFDAGPGSPEGVQAAAPMSEWRQTDGAVGSRIWIKQTGSGNTGWVVTTL